MNLNWRLAKFVRFFVQENAQKSAKIDSGVYNNANGTHELPLLGQNWMMMRYPSIKE